MQGVTHVSGVLGTFQSGLKLPMFQVSWGLFSGLNAGGYPRFRGPVA